MGLNYSDLTPVKMAVISVFFLIRNTDNFACCYQLNGKNYGNPCWIFKKKLCKRQAIRKLTRASNVILCNQRFFKRNFKVL